MFLECVFITFHFIFYIFSFFLLNKSLLPISFAATKKAFSIIINNALSTPVSRLEQSAYVSFCDMNQHLLLLSRFLNALQNTALKINANYMHYLCNGLHIILN